MCKKMPVIPVTKVAGKKKIIRKGRAEEERHKESLIQKIDGLLGS
jgi:hypothetical protein